MKLLKALCISFSIYSKIPVPIFPWEEEDMKYHLIFFPWVGAVIGLLITGWYHLSCYLAVSDICRVLFASAIPLLVTGGFHVDGFMDTMDAFHSYQPKEKKLEILKDPHIGAFSVIMLATLGLIFLASLSEIKLTVIPVFSAGFVLSRCLSGIGVTLFPNAKDKGMLHTFSASAKKVRNTLLTVLFAETLLCSTFMILMNPVCGLISVLAGALCFIYYYHKSMKELGGITGDTAGFFVTITETAVALLCAGYCIVMSLN